jgi:photosystem II stability/assembly factor-like uncharacterized protein
MAKVVVFVGTEKGAFLLSSDENRKKWEIEGPILAGWKVFHLQLDQRREVKLYASVNSYVYGPAIYVSKDLGKNWQQIENGPRYAEDAPGKLNNIWCVEPGRENEPEVLYAGVADAGLFISRDGGQNWTELKDIAHHRTRSEWMPGNGGLCCHAILVDPYNKNRMWVAISAVGVFRSDDGGKSFAIKNDGLEIAIEAKTYKNIGSCVHRLVMDPRNPNRLFQQNHRGVFRSTNGGDSWERIENGLPSNFGFPIAINPTNPDTLFIIPLQSDEYRVPNHGELAVYRSTNGGDSWRPLKNGLPSHCYAGVLRQSMATDTMPDCGIYFGTSGGQIYYSRNNGENWQLMPGLFPRISSITTAVI